MELDTLTKGNQPHAKQIHRVRYWQQSKPSADQIPTEFDKDIENNKNQQICFKQFLNIPDTGYTSFHANLI